MQELSTYFRALADRKRLLIAQYLAQHDGVTVSRLGEELHLSQPLISWHLRLLRRAGIVRTERSGREVWCYLDRTAVLDYEGRLNQLLGLGSRGGDNGERSHALEPAGRQ